MEESSFGRQSAYYRSYKEDPARAREALWKIYGNLDGRIRQTAKEMGCSRNIVRAVIKRMKMAAPMENKPSSHARHGYRR